jgi:signal transduction histidine kinase
VAARITPSLRALLARLTATRVAFAVAVCALVSTQVLFQPLLYQSFSPGHLVDTWFEYLLECLLMGIPVMLGLTVAEALAARRPRVQAIPIAAAGLFAGAFAGALLLVPFYDLDWSSVLGNRFWVDVTFWMVIGGGIAATYAFQQRALAAADHLHAAQIEQAALARRMLEARLQVMRAQIEPHFLFNTLANVKRLCRTDVGDGLTMLDNLILYLRAALPRLRDEHATLGQEVDLVQAYLAVLKIRMGSRLSYAVELPAALRAEPFPPMLLLTLAENAVKHGINPSATGGSIVVTATARAGMLDLEVRDSGVGFGAAATGGTGIGLANTRARQAALHGERASLEFVENAPHGVIAHVRVPLAATTPGASP